MTSVFKIEVTESEEELKKLLRTQTQASKRDRLRALYWHRTGQAKNRRQMAAMLGCAESTIYRWFKTYQNQGLKGLLAVRTSPGRPPKISGQARRALQKQLAKRTGFGSYGEIQLWLAKQHQLETPYSTVHGTVRYRLQGKLKASRPRSSEAEPEVQAKFKKNCQLSLR
jgi:transposase